MGITCLTSITFWAPGMFWERSDQRHFLRTLQPRSRSSSKSENHSPMQKTERKTKFRRGNIWVAESLWHISLGPEMRWNKLPWINILRNQLITSRPKEVLYQRQFANGNGCTRTKLDGKECNGRAEDEKDKPSICSTQPQHQKKHVCQQQHQDKKYVCQPAIVLKYDVFSWDRAQLNFHLRNSSPSEITGWKSLHLPNGLGSFAALWLGVEDQRLYSPSHTLATEHSTQHQGGISYFSPCFDKLSGKKQLWNGGVCFDSEWEGPVHHGHKGRSQGGWGSCSVMSAVRKQKEREKFWSAAYFHGKLSILG